jgi:hypothetical protein
MHSKRWRTGCRTNILALMRLGLFSVSASWVRRVPDTFLGGTTPRLQSLHWLRSDFPALPTLLSFVTGLVCLRLEEIPDTSYISPEEMADLVSSMTGLEELRINLCTLALGTTIQSFYHIIRVGPSPLLSLSRLTRTSSVAPRRSSVWHVD